MITGPLLQSVRFTSSPTNQAQHPFCLPLVQSLKEITFSSQVTFFVGENGSGKSTLLEAIAHKVGFGPEGGSKNIHFKTSPDAHYTAAQLLGEQLTLAWRTKPKNGYFFRAESFYNVANYIDTLTEGLCIPGSKAYLPYGGKSLHAQSHGESFFSFFTHRLGTHGFFIFDEPEAALSPQRQLSLLSIIHRLCKHPDSQFLIATHSPLLLAYPGATIYSCDSGTLEKVSYRDTDHYRITKDFMDHPERFLDLLFSQE